MLPNPAPVDVPSKDVYMTASSWQKVWEAVDDRVKDMAPGTSYVYHVGMLAIDREHDEKVDAIAERYCRHGTPPNFAFGHGCFSDGTGLGRLTQLKISDAKYHYIFTRNRRQQRAADTY